MPRLVVLTLPGEPLTLREGYLNASDRTVHSARRAEDDARRTDDYAR